MFIWSVVSFFYAFFSVYAYVSSSTLLSFWIKFILNLKKMIIKKILKKLEKEKRENVFI